MGIENLYSCLSRRGLPPKKIDVHEVAAEPDSSLELGLLGTFYSDIRNIILMKFNRQSSFTACGHIMANIILKIFGPLATVTIHIDGPRSNEKDRGAKRITADAKLGTSIASMETKPNKYNILKGVGLQSGDTSPMRGLRKSLFTNSLTLTLVYNTSKQKRGRGSQIALPSNTQISQAAQTSSSAKQGSSSSSAQQGSSSSGHGAGDGGDDGGDDGDEDDTLLGVNDIDLLEVDEAFLDGDEGEEAAEESTPSTNLLSPVNPSPRRETNQKQRSRLPESIEVKYDAQATCPLPGNTVLMTIAKLDPRKPNGREIFWLSRAYLYKPSKKLRVGFYNDGWFVRNIWDSRKAQNEYIDYVVKAILKLAGGENRRLHLSRAGIADLGTRLDKNSHKEEPKAEVITLDTIRYLKHKKRRTRRMLLHTTSVDDQEVSDTTNQVHSSTMGQGSESHNQGNNGACSSEQMLHPDEASIAQGQQRILRLQDAVSSLRAKLEILQPNGLRPSDIAAAAAAAAKRKNFDEKIADNTYETNNGKNEEIAFSSQEMVLSQTAASQSSILLWDEVALIIESLDSAASPIQKMVPVMALQNEDVTI
ncbi:hypothetical protein BX616_003520, partial [Lobosporangium transversale]